MLPRLDAERELASINAMSAANGGMRKMDRQRYVGRLVRAANGGSAAAAMRPTPEAMAAMGIAVVIVEPVRGANVDG